MTPSGHRFRNHLRSFLSKLSVDQEVDRELGFHLEMRARELMEAGMAPEDARAEARRRFGDVGGVKQRLRRIAERRDRRVRIQDCVRDLWHDLVFAARQMRKAPAWTLIVVSILAVGIGANALVFSVVDAVVLQPLPYHEPDRLVRIQEVSPRGQPFTVSAPNFLDFREQSRSFTDLAALADPLPQVTLLGGDAPQRLDAMACTASLFPVLGATAALGRTFRPEETVHGSEARVVILSHPLWIERFGGDPEILGRTLNLDGDPWTVVGVMPEGFRFLVDRDVWIPFGPDPGFERGDHRIDIVVGRLKPGVALAEADAEMKAIAGRLGLDHPESNAGWSVLLRTLPEWIIGPGVRQVALMLQVAVALMLLLAAANVSSLLVARVVSRRQELGVRAALGAGRWRLMRQLLTESVALALLGSAGGLLFARWALPALRSIDPEALPRLDDTAVDGRVVLFAVLASLATGLLAGALPALHILRGRLLGAVSEGRSIAGGRARRLRDGLVVAELALTVMLLIGAGLLLTSFRELNRVELGFEPGGVLFASFKLPESEFGDMSRESTAFYRQVLERLEGAPGVRAAGINIVNPFRGPRPTNRVAPLGATNEQELVWIQWRSVTPGVFPALGIPLLQGRMFDERDRAGGERVAIISRGLAERLWPGEDPVDRRMHWIGVGGPAVRVIGVVGDVRDVALGSEPPPMVYYQHDQMPWRDMTLLVKADGDPAALAPLVRAAVRDVRDTFPAPPMGTLDDSRSAAVATPRLNVRLLGVFAGIALLVGVIGVYGIVSYSVEHRRDEIGVRMALGARPGQMVQLILMRALFLVGSGALLGAAGAFGLTRFLRGLLYETSPTDLTTFAVVVFSLTAVGLIAGYLPARRAARVDPVVTLHAR